MSKDIDYDAPSELLQIKRQELTVGDGIRFGIGFILAPAVLASFIAFFIMVLGSCVGP